MPVNNRFRHQEYSAAPPLAPYEVLQPPVQPDIQGGEVDDRLAAVGATLEAAQVRAIYLVHGTFAGTDALGMIREIGRFSPTIARHFHEHRKQLFDALAGDVGNFSRGFVQQFQSSINRRVSREISVKTFDWSGENHHLGRVEGALRLLVELCERDIHGPHRILLIGHSHAGNVFALLTNLLSADAAGKNEFLRAASDSVRLRARRPLLNVASWSTIRDLLSRASDMPFLLDMVTMGTPVRYGWESSGYAKLLHVIHHRPAEGLPSHQAPFPPGWEDLRNAIFGDFVQQFGIAGTNFAPYLLNWRNWRAELRLNKFLQPTLRKRDLVNRLRFGQRIHHDGIHLLVDYPADDPHVTLLLGHGIYTRREWLAFHAEQIARAFYE